MILANDLHRELTKGLGLFLRFRAGPLAFDGLHLQIQELCQLAGERIAALFGQVKYPYNINTLTQQTAAECLRRDIAAQIAQIREERGRLAAALAGCGCIQRVYPSQANFLLVKTADPDRLYGELIAAGVIVRNRTRLTGCEGCLRITVGTPAENARMLETVKNFRP